MGRQPIPMGIRLLSHRRPSWCRPCTGQGPRRRGGPPAAASADPALDVQLLWNTGCPDAAEDVVDQGMAWAWRISVSRGVSRSSRQECRSGRHEPFGVVEPGIVARPWLHHECDVREQPRELGRRPRWAVQVALSGEQQDGASQPASAARVVSGLKAPSAAKRATASWLLGRPVAWCFCATASQRP